MLTINCWITLSKKNDDCIQFYIRISTLASLTAETSESMAGHHGWCEIPFFNQRPKNDKIETAVTFHSRNLCMDTSNYRQIVRVLWERKERMAEMLLFLFISSHRLKQKNQLKHERSSCDVVNWNAKDAHFISRYFSTRTNHRGCTDTIYCCFTYRYVLAKYCQRILTNTYQQRQNVSTSSTKNSCLYCYDLFVLKKLTLTYVHRFFSWAVSKSNSNINTSGINSSI